MDVNRGLQHGPSKNRMTYTVPYRLLRPQNRRLKLSVQYRQHPSTTGSKAKHAVASASRFGRGPLPFTISGYQGP